jgi:hypothetical protein
LPTRMTLLTDAMMCLVKKIELCGLSGRKVQGLV